MSENPKAPLGECADCKNSFKLGQDYWELQNNYQKETKEVINYCLTCWDKYETNKKKWESKCIECQKSFSQDQDYWELKYQGKVVMNSCLDCWNKHNTEKKKWK